MPPDAKGGAGQSSAEGGSATGGATSSGGAVASGGATGNGGATTGGSQSTGGVPGTVTPPHPTSQVDLLFMIDNSLSMADKQVVLAEAMPQLLARLATPICVDASGEPTGVNASSDGSCADGSPEFAPVNDIHIGVITSSLGAHGGQTCVDSYGDDKAQLIAKFRPDPAFPYVTWDDSGVLAWDPDSTRNTPPGESNFSNFAGSLKNMILSAGQSGCGYEASLEAWYRFLIEPDPPTSIPQVTDPSQSTMPIIPANPAQNPVLVQRAAFLRPDSALVIVMLSDENDCSILDAGQGWLIGTQNLGEGAFHMPRATSACEANPNDPCCVSCAASSAPAGCPSPGTDPACTKGSFTAMDDNLNLRCWDQKRRFGFDLLYPLARYVDGLTQSTITRRNGEVAINPLFSKGGRTPSMVFLTGIVGVPWQDLATEESLTGASLEYLSHDELTAQGRWFLVVGEVSDGNIPPKPPGDKLMFETTADRTALFGAAAHPLLGAPGALVPSARTARENVINGHETNIADNSELQYACIFPLETPRDCASGVAACDCKAQDAMFNRSVCDGTTQTHAKAYPSVRQLRVLKEFGDRTGNAITTSICPKTLPTPEPTSGYGPAVSALVGRLKPVLVP